ncbi:TIGR01906 family membrane protein [Melissococcus plutonius]|uniref:Integral membrane protein n=1 Tax=Melissococcus plutonius TaxID=33970 RepID=A0A2Z5Y2C5_9ENTE|nr:TIGR01906 family membrane protein [Melissococcus plutonius]BAL62015.1 integral membrane protein [Melissococcus plutonius DAT561]MCV2499142.1 TIGR01906 family membrane protein [Melissococcus plutonius]MCV2500328.1 TIGR01906 family membrane protein [Melissococcus plutonius]MCV2505121.1 TIGR01906 family membrane protein [Melissococcus plutonius]MCV2507647.1 TIGR01906 family membrane protein [Melissococcus plutonius]
MRLKQQMWLENLGIICIILTIISLSITITINFRPLYIADMTYLKIPSMVMMSRATILKNFDHLMGYLNNPFVKKLFLPNFSMSKNGASHFYEVKRLFLFCYSVLGITWLPSSLYLYYFWHKKRFWRLMQPFRLLLWGPIILIVVVMFNFEQFFIFFHQFLFNNNDWMFNPVTDPVINILPAEFFLHCFILCFILLEGLFLLGYFLGKKEIAIKNISTLD